MMGEAWLAIKAWALWARVGRAAGAARGWAMRNPLAAALVLALMANGLTIWFWRWADRDLAAARVTIAQIHAAQKVATDNQIHINQLPAITSAAIARASDAKAPAYYAAVHRAVDDHSVIVRHDACPAVAAGVPGADRAAPVDDRPDPGAVMVSRPKADDDQIIDAAGRGLQCHADAMSLIASGVAVAEPQGTNP